MAPPPPPSLQCTCGANTANTTPKKPKKKGSSNATNPYADRGREKFAALLVEVEEQRKKIMTEVGKDDVSLIRFVCTKENKLKPVVVKSNNNSSNSSSDRSFKGKAKTLEEKVSIVDYDDGKVLGGGDKKEEALEEEVKIVDDYDEKVIVGGDKKEILKLETNMNKPVDDQNQNGLIVLGLGNKLKPMVGLSKNKSYSSSSSGDRSFKGLRGKTLKEKMKVVDDDDDDEKVDQGIMLFGVEDRRLLVKKLKAEVAKMQLQPYLCYLATLLIIVSVSLASFGNNWIYLYILQIQASLCRPRP